MKLNLDQLKNIFQQNRKLIFIIAGIFLVLLILLPSRRPSPTPPSPSPDSFSQLTRQSLQDYTLPDYTQPPTKPDGQADTDNPSVQAAIQTKQTLQTHLPLYSENFPTSVNISTTINIYTLPQDPNYLIRLDIYGINYHHSSTDETINPHATAFKESFLKAKSLLEEKGVNLQSVYFIFGGRPYIQQTAQEWIKHFNLL